MAESEKEQVQLWTVAVGNLPTPFSMPWVKRRSRKAVEFIIDLEGFVGFLPLPPRGTLCLFRTKNDAIRAKNMMEARGIITGDNICSCLVDEVDLPKGADQE